MRASTSVGSILVHIDLEGARPHRSSLAALATARAVASSWGATLYAAMIVHDPGEPAAPVSIEAELASYGADKVLVVATDTPVLPLWSAIGGAWQTVVTRRRPRLVVFGADAPSAAELGPRTGAGIGARLLMRAHATGGDVLELRDRDGAFLRIGDGGAAVVLVGGRAPVPAPRDYDVDLERMVMPSGADARIQLASTAPAEPAQALHAVIALGDDAAQEPAVVEAASRLATLVGAPLLRTTRTDPHAHSSAELFVGIGATGVEPSGASCVIRIGGRAERHTDGALDEPVAPALAALVCALEARS
jgi:hypothetical protein